MSLLITGGLGFLGANLCYEFLRENKTKVIAYDVLYRMPKFLKEFEGDERFIFVKGDITDAWNLMETVKKYDVTEIIHVATLMEDKASLQRPYQFLTPNIFGGLNVLEVARVLSLRRLIIISSRAAYGSYSPSDGPLREDFPLKPFAFYGASKASLDLILPLYRTHYNTDAVSIRTTGIFGPGQGEEGMGHVGITTLIYNILSSVLKGKPFYLDSGGDHFLEFCYVKDLVRGIKTIFEVESVRHPIYNISFGKQYRLSELGNMIRELLPQSNIHIGPGHLQGIELRAALDIRRAQEEFGYQPSPLKESIKDFMNYLTS